MRVYVAHHRRTFDFLARKYERTYDSDRAFSSHMLAQFCAVIRAQFEEPRAVLDVGCGVGAEASILCEEGFDVTGIDVSPVMVKHAQKHAPHAHIQEADFLEMRLEQQYSGVVLMNIIHEFPSSDTNLFFRQVKKALLPQGYCFISLFFGDGEEGFFENQQDGTIIYDRRWKEKDLQKALERHQFSIEEAVRYKMGDDDKTPLEKRYASLLLKNCSAT